MCIVLIDTNPSAAPDMIDPAPSPRDGLDEDGVRALLARLSRPHRSGGVVVERAALVAAGADFDTVMAWITKHGGRAEAPIVPKRRQMGLHAARETPNDVAPLRFVLPAGAL